MKTLNIKKALSALLVMLMLTFAVAVPAFAAGPDDQPAETAASQSAEAAQAEAEGMTAAGKAIACAVAVGIAAAGGAVGMGILGAKSSESIARQPEAEGKIRTSMMLTLVFIETAIIYALLVAILIIFVL